jgi:hypothetical protein
MGDFADEKGRRSARLIFGYAGNEHKSAMEPRFASLHPGINSTGPDLVMAKPDCCIGLPEWQPYRASIISASAGIRRITEIEP